MEKIGVYLTTFNRAEYLGSTIKSILSQTYKNFNLYILDNRSTDNTREIISKFEDQRIIYFLNETNLGMVGNWNRALEISKEPYITVFHDDDLMMENYLEEILQFYSEFPDVIFVHTAARIINSKGQIISSSNANWDYLSEGDEFFKQHLKYGGSVIAPSVTINKKKLPKYERFDNSLPFTPDINFWLRISKYGKIGYLNTPLLQYRRHDSSTTNILLGKIDIKIKDRLRYKKFLEEEIKARKLVIDRAKKWPQEYLNGAFTRDLFEIRFYSGSVLNMFKSMKKFIKVNPLILLYVKFYFYVVVSLLPNWLIAYLQRLNNGRKIKKFANL